jgi:uncharacterized protein YgiM (DUF1202 family)
MGAPSQPSHVVTADTLYYTTGPQQGRPPDGTLAAGTRVTLLTDGGSYSQVTTEDDITCWVASDDLAPITSSD